MSQIYFFTCRSYKINWFLLAKKTFVGQDENPSSIENILPKKKMTGLPDYNRELLTFPNGNKKYMGELKDSQYHGKGSLYFPDGN
jgi:hypothetical protein